MKRTKIPSIRKDCIPYIESTGWKFIGHRHQVYTFRGCGGRTLMNGNDTVQFTMTELRHAFNYGW